MKDSINYRKAASLLLAGTMVFTLTACGKGGDKNDPSGATAAPPVQGTAQTGTQSQTEPAPADPFGKYEPEITLSSVRSLDSTTKFDETNPDRKSITENIWARTYEEELGIKIDYMWTPNPEQYTQKWNVAIASKDIPDFAVVDANLYKQLVEGGLVEDMTDYYEQYAGDLYKQANLDEDNLTIRYMTYDGRLMGLPQTGATADGITLMFIRQDWLGKVGKSVPTTIAQLKETAKAFIDAGLGGDSTVGIAASKDISTGIHCLKGIMEGCGAYHNYWVDDGNGGLAYGSVLPEMRTAVQELADMYAQGLFRQDFATIDGSKAGEDVVSGKSGITFGTFWAPYNSIADSIKSDAEADWIVCALPTADGSEFTSSADAAPSGYLFVKKGCAHPEAVVKLMNLDYKYVATADKNYNTDDDGFEAFKYMIAPNAGVPWKNLDCWKAVNEALKTGDTSTMNENDKNAYVKTKDGLAGNREYLSDTLIWGPEGTYRYVNDLKESGRIVVNGYQALPTETMTQKSLDLQTNLDAAIFKAIMNNDMGIYEKAVETWKSTGGDQITKEVNEWYAGTAK